MKNFSGQQALQTTTAVIYCRVSSKKQEKAGDGLHSQETRCREYARFKGYHVETVFNETLSGASTIRPAMTELIQHLRAHKKHGPRIVLIDSQTRFARDVVGYWHLRESLKKAGGLLESPTHQFGDSSHDRLLETVLAAGDQYQRELNAEQSRDRMRSRSINGYWPFQAPIGYRHEIVNGHKGKLLVRDEPLASIIQEALEGYASGRFQLQAEVKRFFESQPAFPKGKRSLVRFQQVVDILKSPIYAGFVHAQQWNVGLREGKHEALISAETREKILRRMAQASHAPARADIRADFPLRGAVACADCGRPLSACWTKGSKGTRYPYYFCQCKECPRWKKSISRGTIEERFVAVLKQMTPSARLRDIAYAMFKDAWNQRIAQSEATAKGLEREAGTVQKEIETLLGKITLVSSETVLGVFEKRIEALELQKRVLAEKLANSRKTPLSFEELFEPAMEFLGNPLKLWESENFEHRRLLLRLAFTAPLQYCPDSGFRTPAKAAPFEYLSSFSEGQTIGAPERRKFERAEFGQFIRFPCRLEPSA